MLRPIALSLLCFMPAFVAAQDPPKPPAPAKKSIDQLLDELSALDATIAGLTKDRAAKKAELDQRVKDLKDKLDKLNPPGPPAPAPDTRLKDKLKAALDLDKGQKADVVQLAFVYEQAAAAAEDKTIPHTKELLTRVRAVSDQLLGDDSLFNLRVAVSEELLAVIGMTSEEPITDGQRKRAADLWRNTTAILKEFAK